MTTENNVRESAARPRSEANEYSAINKPGPGRREIIRKKRESARRAKPYVIVGLLLLLAIAAIPAYDYFQTYVSPPTKQALRVEDKVYTLGDVVDFIRFNQRLSEDIGQQFDVGSSLFEALEIMQNNEIAYRAAPALGVTVTDEELDAQISLILGFPNLTPEERANPDIVINLEEAELQFLNRVGLSRDAYLDILRKSLFKEQIRELLSESVPRIQPQAHVYEIVLAGADPQVLQRIQRALAGGDTPEEVAVQFSTDPNVQRTGGDVGWFPAGVVPSIDHLLWDVNDDGARVLPLGEPSEPQYNSDSRTYNVYVVTELSEAREISPTVLQKLSDVALDDFINARRAEYSGREFEGHPALEMSLDSDVYNWVNRQVRLASILPSPTPQQTAADQLGLR